MDSNKTEHGIRTLKNTPRTSIPRSMSSDQPADQPISSAFLLNLFREQGITDINLVSDNAKPRATVPLSVFLQSQNERENRSVSRWDSIPRNESADAPDNWHWTRRITAPTFGGERRRQRTSYSLSPTIILQRQKSPPSQNVEKSTSSLEHNKNSSLKEPTVLQDNWLELVGTDDACRTPEKKMKLTSGLYGNLDTDSNPQLRKPARQRSSIDSAFSLRMPQRRASIESKGPSKPHRVGRRASSDTTHSTKITSKSYPLGSWRQLTGADGGHAKDGNETDSTQELTPSPTKFLEAATKMLKLSDNPIHVPPLNTPPSKQRTTSRRSSTGSLLRTSEAKKSQRDKSPPHQQPGTPPGLRRGQRKPRDSRRTKSPPPPKPAPPPSLKRALRVRRHSDSIINTDMEVSKQLLNLSQVSSPVQPVRRRSVGREDLESRDRSIEDFESDQEQEEEEVQSAIAKAQHSTDHEDSDTSSSKGIEQDSKTKVSKGNTTSPGTKTHISPQVNFSPSRSEKKSVPRVCFSPRRQHSAPLAGVNTRPESDSETSLLASFRRRKPFSPGSTFTNTAITASKTGTITRTITRSPKNSPRASNNRDIVKASVLEHGSEGEGEYWFNPDSGHSSIGSLDMVSILDILRAPPLDTPSPKSPKKKKSSRRTSLPPVILDLPDSSSPQKSKKKKKSRRRSVH